MPPTSRPSSNSSSSGAISTARPASHTRAPMLPIPQRLASHKLNPRPNTTRPRFPSDESPQSKKDYVFLSSSPRQPQDEAETTDSPLSSKACEQQENNSPVQAAMKSHDSRPATTQHSDSRPAATFHTTSVAQIQAANTVQKKTLGVRRSMNGWSSRVGQGFAVPGRARHGS